MLWEILKASKGLPVDDLFAALWGKKIAAANDWPLTTLTGTLPLTFQSKGTPLTDYKLYGTSEGAGVETENLFVGWVGPYDLFIVDDVPTVVTSRRGYVFFYAPVEEGQVYCVTGPKNHWENGAFFDHIPQEGDVPYNSEYANFTSRSNTDKVGASVFTAPMTGYFIYSSGIMYKNMLMLSLGDKPLSFPYIPYGYKLPMTVESGEESPTTPIYIGDSKLGAEEYVDYENGKVWKQRDNLFDAEQIVEDSISTASTYIEDGWLHYNTGPTPITINVDGQVGETFQFKLYIKNFSTVSSNNIRFILHYSDETSVITASNSYAAGISRYAQFASNPNKELVSVVSQNTSNRNAGIEISKSLIVKSDTMPETYLNPTNPPVPFPEISTYSGENTLSCSEALGEVSITGYIKEAGNG